MIPAQRGNIEPGCLVMVTGCILCPENNGMVGTVKHVAPDTEYIQFPYEGKLWVLDILVGYALLGYDGEIIGYNETDVVGDRHLIRLDNYNGELDVSEIFEEQKRSVYS